MRDRHPAPLLFILALMAHGCGGATSDSLGPVGDTPSLSTSTVDLVDGAIWKLNRPIEIKVDRPVSFSSVNAFTVAGQRRAGGATVIGTYSPGIDPVTGAENPNVIRF